MGEDKLRDEIQASQRELARWKLLGLGGLGALSLGFAANSGRETILVCSIIPFFAAYCDLINREHEIRIAIIAAFLRTQGEAFATYESFINTEAVAQTRWWRFGVAVGLVPSLLACCLTIVLGMAALWVPGLTARPSLVATVLTGAGVLGVVLTLSVELIFRSKHLWRVGEGEVLALNTRSLLCTVLFLFITSFCLLFAAWNWHVIS